MFTNSRLRRPFVQLTVSALLACGLAVSSAAVAAQADVDHSSVDNSAVASAASPAGPVEAGASTPPVATAQSPGLTVLSSVDPTAVSAAGQTVRYSFQITNSGDVTISDLGVGNTSTAPAGPALSISCPVTVLAPGTDTTCTADYQVTQADVDHGRIDDTESATGRTPTDDPVTAAGNTTTVTIARVDALGLVESSSVSTVARVGRAVTYFFAVTNNGNTTVDDVTVTDVFLAPAGPAMTPSCPQTSLRPQTSTTCTAIYLVSQADLDHGSIDNTAAAHGTARDDSAVVSNPSSTSIAVTQQPAISVAITATVVDRDDDGRTDLGDTIAWSIVVSNPGNVTLTQVSVDDLAPYVVTCPSATVAAGTSMTCTATHTITQDDVDAGHVRNTADAGGTDPNGQPVTAPSDHTSTTVDSTNGLTVLQTASATTITTVGQHVTFTVMVTNSGTTTLTGVELTDALASPAGPALAIVCPSTTELAPNAKLTCTAGYASTPADFDTGSITAAASARARPPTGAPLAAGPSVAVVSTTQTPMLGLVKKASVTDLNGNGYADLDDTIRWTLVVTNTGTVTLDDVAVTDRRAGVVACPRTTLAAGETETCTATAVHVITQADVDAGTVDNTATVGARSPDTAGSTVVSPPSSTSTPIGARPGLTLVKTGALVDTDNDGVVDPGDRVLWAFLIGNTGNVTMSDIHVDDPLGGHVTCQAASLAPGLSTACKADRPHTLTSADVEHGSLSNTAHAIGTPSGARPILSAASTATVPLPARPALVLVTSAQVTDTDGDGVNGAGDRVTWLFRVTNTGNVTIAGVRIVDPGAGPIGCARTSLAPAASMSCTSRAHTITEREADRSRLTNTATATGRKARGATITSPPSSATVTIDSPYGNLGGNNGPGASGNGGLPVGPNGVGNLASTGEQSLPSLVRSGLLALLIGLSTMLAGVGPRRRRFAAHAPRHRSEGNSS